MIERVKAFVSFCKSDRLLAQRLQKDLAAAGCDSWQFDVSAIPGADAWESILQRIENSDIFIVLLSEAATLSRGVTEEISHAHYVSLNSTDHVPRIIPLMLSEAVAVPRKIIRTVRLQFREASYASDFALLLGTIGLESSPFNAASDLEVTVTAPYELQAETQVARYAEALIKNNSEIAGTFKKVALDALGGSEVNFYVSSPQVLTQSEHVLRFRSPIGPAVRLQQQFWVFFGLLEKNTQGYDVARKVVMQVAASQERQFDDVGDERVLRTDSLRLQFEGFQKIAASEAAIEH